MKKFNPAALRYLLVLALCWPALLTAQMLVGADTLYGNEWIDHSRTYYKINVADDAIYRIDFQALTAAGIPVATVPGNQWRLYREGQQVPIFTTTEGVFSTGDFLEFWGEKQRSSLDDQLFDAPQAERLNPWYGLFNDTSAYFLTWESNTPALRYTNLTNDLSNLPAAEPYCWQTDAQVFSSAHLKREIGEEVTYSWFNGDGFHRGETTNSVLNYTPPGLYAGAAPSPTVRLRFACNKDEHQQQIFLHDSLYAETGFYGWKIVDSTFSVARSKFAPGLKVEIKGIATPYDRHALAALEWGYPRTFNFGGANAARFALAASGADKYLEISNLNTSNGAPVLLDLRTRQRLLTTVEGNLTRVRLDASSTDRDVVLAAPGTSALRLVTALRPVQFRNYLADKTADYVIVSHQKLFSDPTMGGANHVEEYADYRRSAAGGSHQVAVVEVNELYEQFGYGVRHHPIAIRNFCHFIKKNWTNPQYLLFIGKGLDYRTVRTHAAMTALADSLHFVPMYGAPAVDQCYLMRRGGISTPILAVGRLAVVRPRQISDYLNKLIEHEDAQNNSQQTLAERAWMKRVIHISGGLGGETALIRSFAENMANTLRTNRFGADVATFFKTSNDPIQNSAYEQIRGRIKEGTALWMIYGHSSTFAVDFDIGSATLYQNAPRYPYMMIMGCFTGTCSLTQSGLGEEYVLTPKSGAIAYSASTNYSFIDGLYSYGQRFYERVGGVDYGQSIGRTARNTIGSLSTSTYPSLVAILHQNVLQGDPAVRLQTAPGPDYLIDPQSVKFTPNPIPVDQATSAVTFDVANIGENVSGQIAVKIEQRQPDGSLRTLVSDTVAAPALRSRLDYPLATGGSRVGYSRFLVTVDATNAVAEAPAAAELNNDLRDGAGEPGVEVYLYSNDVQPVYPPAFGIVGKNRVSLRASTLSTGSGTVRYLFEIDTLETFDSPFKQNKELLQAGGLLEWAFEKDLRDSTVYYWRVARDSLVNGAVPWRTSSFVYLKESPPGWNQSDYGQYATNTLTNLQGLDSLRRVEFISNFSYLLVKVGYRNQNVYPGLTNAYYEGFLGDYGWNVTQVPKGVCLMVHDPATGHVIQNPPDGPFNSTPGQQRHFFWFDTADSLKRIGLMQFIENQIPDGAAVGLLAFNEVNDQLGYDPENWGKDSVSYGKNLFQVFEAQGAKRVRQLAQFTGVPVPYGFVFRKNDPAFAAVDTFVTQPLAVAELRRDFPARWFSGQMETTRIGPAKAWQTLFFRPGPTDDSSDNTVLSVLGERPNGQTDTLLLTFNSAIEQPLADLSATEYPYLKLRYAALDTSEQRTATPVEYLRVLYQPLPEGALHPTAHFEFLQDTLEQGQNLHASIAFANVADAAFDSLTVHFRVENPTGNQLITQKLQPLAAGDTLHATLNLSTIGLNGPQRLLIDVNPVGLQPEQYHFNNVLFRDFYVNRDRRNPLLDVTFDGSHLLDGDLVSPKPEIVVVLKDDNRFLALTDTALFAMKVLLPDGSTLPLSFTDPNVVFVPADAGNLPAKNQARVEWRPTFTQDGDYQLIVNGRDASGNESATLDYTVNFKVITKSSLSNLLNYPNPFSTSTCFVYTMTGAETPVQFKLQIMTVSGKVVREVTAAEFGPLTAGTHQSNFCWDGKDEYGDQLANGVYLYRITARKADGTAFEFFENSSVDGYFKGGFGKMVLMR